MSKYVDLDTKYVKIATGQGFMLGWVPDFRVAMFLRLGPSLAPLFYWLSFEL